jgi:hypothetical protein
MRRAVSTFVWDRGGLLLFVVLPVYLWIAPPFITDGDNAEFSTLAITGGASHPPGYPLYVLYLRAMSWLPGSPAGAAATATALLGAMTVLVVHAACRAWGARPAGASIATALFAGSPVALRLHTAAEVFALNNLIVACVLWLSASGGPLRGTPRALALGLVAGLGLANHHTCVLVAPVGILGAIRGVRETRAPALLTIGAAIGGLAIGLLPYLSLLQSETAASWGHASSIDDLLAYFTREAYGGAGAFGVAEGTTDRVANVLAVTRSLGRAYLWLPSLLGVIVLGVRAFRCTRARGESRAAWALLAVSTLLAGPVLALRFNIYPSGLGLAICERFHVMAMVLLAVPVAMAVDMTADWIATRAKRELIATPRLREVATVAVFATTAGLSLPYVKAMHSPAVEHNVCNVLGSLPEHAVVMLTADDLYFGANYAQHALGVRPDVTVIAWGIAGQPWYRDRISRQGITIETHMANGDVPSVRVARQVLALDRPLFVELSMGNVARALPSYPYGGLLRILSPGSPAPSLDEIVAENQRVFAGYDLTYPRPSKTEVYGLIVHERYARAWDVIGGALAKAGRAQDAAAARDVARQLMPPGFFEAGGR